MNPAEINRAAPERKQDRHLAGPIICGMARQAGSLSYVDGIHTSTLLLLLRLASIENHPISGFERRFQVHQHTLASHLLDFAQVNPALFAETRVNELLVIDATEPASVG